MPGKCDKGEINGWGAYREEERTRSERGSAIKGNSVGGAFALPTSPSSFSKKEKGKKEK